MATPRHRGSVRVGCALALVVLLALPAGTARATLTAPNLRLDAVEIFPGEPGEGAWMRVTGDFPWADVVERGYALQLFLREDRKDGTHFVCYSTLWGPMEGHDGRIEKGLKADEALTIGEVAARSETARFLEIVPGRIEVLLPVDFPPGAAEVQLFVVYQDQTPLFSNPIPFEVPEPEEDE